jgi:hypothetical protein
VELKRKYKAQQAEIYEKMRAEADAYTELSKQVRDWARARALTVPV